MKSFRISVKKIISSRYPEGVSRPQSWDDRIAGTEVVETECGKTFKLFSDGQQSTPQHGWELLVDGSSENIDGALSWTLFGMPKGSVFLLIDSSSSIGC